MIFVCPKCNHKQVTPDIKDCNCHKCGHQCVWITPHILIIEPEKPCTPLPLIDHYTKAIVYAWRNCHTQSDAWRSYRGEHFAKCGMVSDNHDHWLYGFLTTSLAIHYIAYHREEVPKVDLNKVDYYWSQEDQECYPTDAELKPAWFDKTQSRIVRAK